MSKQINWDLVKGQLEHELGLIVTEISQVDECTYELTTLGCDIESPNHKVRLEIDPEDPDTYDFYYWDTAETNIVEFDLDTKNAKHVTESGWAHGDWGIKIYDEE